MTGDLVNAKLVLIVNRFLAHTLLVYSPSPFMSSMAYFIRKVLLRVIWSKTNPAFRVSAQKIIGNKLLHQKLFWLFADTNLAKSGAAAAFSVWCVFLGQKKSCKIQFLICIERIMLTKKLSMANIDFIHSICRVYSTPKKLRVVVSACFFMLLLLLLSKRRVRVQTETKVNIPWSN